jgi:hypothetical protein
MMPDFPVFFGLCALMLVAWVAIEVIVRVGKR